MIEQLVNLFISVWDFFVFWVVVDPWEEAGIIRLGHYNRTLEPGFHWKWPIIEYPVIEDVVTTTMGLPSQSLTTLDEVPLVVSTIVKYSIVDLELFQTEIYDAEDALADIICGRIKDVVTENNYEDCKNIEKRIAELAREEVRKYGIKIAPKGIVFTTFQRCPTLRLITESPYPVWDEEE